MQRLSFSGELPGERENVSFPHGPTPVHAAGRRGGAHGFLSTYPTTLGQVLDQILVYVSTKWNIALYRVGLLLRM
jgi:hypothetical protein